MLTQDALHKLLTYDPETGLFTRNIRAKGKTCGHSLKKTGHIQITIGEDRHYAHRLAWLYCYGESPAYIDHIDGDPSNNKVSNLRVCTKGQNSQNRRRVLTKSSSGLLGVSWHNKKQAWAARIMLKGVSKHLGYFETKEEAHDTYLAAKRTIHEFNTL